MELSNSKLKSELKNLFAITVFGLITVLGFSQTKSTYQGKVLSNSGDPLEKAIITLSTTDKLENAVSSVNSDAAGSFVVEATAGEHSGHARQNAELVLNEDGDRVSHGGIVRSKEGSGY